MTATRGAEPGGGGRARRASRAGRRARWSACPQGGCWTGAGPGSARCTRSGGQRAPGETFVRRTWRSPELPAREVAARAPLSVGVRQAEALGVGSREQETECARPLASPSSTERAQVPNQRDQQVVPSRRARARFFDRSHIPRNRSRDHQQPPASRTVEPCSAVTFAGDYACRPRVTAAGQLAVTPLFRFPRSNRRLGGAP